MTKKLTNKIKDPNPNGDWISLWTFNEEDNGKIILDKDNVLVDSESITNIGNLVTQITDPLYFWNPVSNQNAGYAPQGAANSYLFLDNNGNSRWVQLTYDKITYNNEIDVNSRTVNFEYNNPTQQQDGNPLLTLREPSTTDYILNLNKFLYGEVTAYLKSPQIIQTPIDPHFE